jgi:hypothetical protein
MPDGEIRTHVVWQPGANLVEETKKLCRWRSAHNAQMKDYGDSPPFPRLQHNPPPHSFEEALTQAIAWAEAAEDYILNSGEFAKSCWILDEPSYGCRAIDGHSTHSYYHSRSNFYYICFEPQPRIMSDAIAIAKEWSERIEAYILHGHRF